MDPIVDGFINTYLTQELAQTVRQTLDICEDIYIEYDEIRFIELISNEANMHKEDLVDQFVALVDDMISEIIKAHHFTLVDSLPLYEKTEFVSALVALQDSNMLEEVERLISSDLPHDEMISEMLSLYSHLSAERFLSFIVDYDKNFVDYIKVMVADKSEDLSKPSNIDKKLIDKFRMFKKFINGSCLGFKLIESNFPPNLEFEQYFTFVKDNLVIKDIDLDKYIIDLYSVIMLCKDGLENPVSVFRENSTLLTDEINIISKLDVGIIQISTNFATYCFNNRS